MRLALILPLLCAGALAAQAPDSQARRILEQPPYKGYRIERPAQRPDSGNWGGEERTGDSAYSGDSDRSRENRFRRTGQGESRRGYRSDGGDGSSGWGSGPDLGWLGAVFEVIVWIVVVAAAMFGLFFLVKAILGIKRDRRKSTKKRAEKKERPKPEVEQPQDGAPAAEPVPEVFADALAIAMREYEQAVAARQWGRAVVLAWRIFWLRAGWQGCVEDTDVHTWRDALRMVRAAETRQRVRGLLRLVETVRYGEHAPDGDEFAAWRAQLDGLNPREALR